MCVCNEGIDGGGRVGERERCPFTHLHAGARSKAIARKKRESNDRGASFGSAAGGACLSVMKCLGSTSSSQEVFSRSQQINLTGGHLS